MRKLTITLSILLAIAGMTSFSQQFHHELMADLDIENKTIDVRDYLCIPSAYLDDDLKLKFVLNKHLELEAFKENYTIRKLDDDNAESTYNTYELQLYAFSGDFFNIPLHYSGIISDDITAGAAEYARGFSETSGTITDDGVFLAGSTYWIPGIEDYLFTFNLTVSLDESWGVVSQGTRTVNKISDGRRTTKYESPDLMEEIYLVAAEWTEYELQAGDVMVQAFLRTADEGLANKYLGVTSSYLSLYESLIGPYPFTKFALVENFWETGYGMPSFTLLGEKVIRFPWILHSSYPHELLHNWWGNSVYVDFNQGNWCEGATAYMADHLIKEQQGLAGNYRRTTLQKFTDYVNEENDFPVVEFRSRNNSAEEAIGYGKCLMFNHMLRKELGDDKFIKAYSNFYEENKFKVSSCKDILASFQPYADHDLQPFFDQWLLRKGAPSIELSGVRVEEDGEMFKMEFTLSQKQQEAVFNLRIPVAVYFENEVELMEVKLDSRTAVIRYQFDDRPLRIEVDPFFDVFRRIDRGEVPPALSQVFGSTETLIVLPDNSELADEYRQLAETWKATQEAQGLSLEIVDEADLDELPDDRAVWILGYENKYKKVFSIHNDYASYITEEQAELLIQLSQNGSLVYALPNPANRRHTIGFVGTAVKDAVPGLTRLLSHYGKYSYLGFEGARPSNVLKGTFPALDSPLHYDIMYQGVIYRSKTRLKPAPPLADMPLSQ